MRAFRFGVLLGAAESAHVATFETRGDFEQKIQRLEGLGFDVLSVPDHLESVALLPALAAAGVTSNMHLSTCVLNAAFYKPALMIPDDTETYRLSDGRLELGLGAGYVQRDLAVSESAAASRRARVGHLERVTAALYSRLPKVPIMIAGKGNRLLSIAAKRSDIVGLTGEPGRPGSSEHLADRVGVIGKTAGPRFQQLELNLLLSGIPTDGMGRADLSLVRRRLPGLADDEPARLPGVMHGRASEIACRLRTYRELYNISCFAVMEFHAEYFATIIEESR